MAAIPTDPPILFRDQRFVVLDKPAGLPVHPGPKGGPSVEDWFPALSRRKDGPWLAHRLDADTAGCLVIALRKAALIAAQAAFAEGRAGKTYWAVVSGGPSSDAGTVNAPLARRDGKSGWRMVADPAGQRAVTDWRVLGRTREIAWLELHPRTGRTHQIRVHCALLGCPILGDPVYGAGAAEEEKSKNLPLPLRQGVGGRGRNRTDRAAAPPLPGPPPHGGRETFANTYAQLHLLARAISLPLDPTLFATAEPPSHMRPALARCGWTIARVIRSNRKNS
jgi:tRNA pseudouridine32 synthase/23S rRNA pseudouridine746 synthase